VKPRGGGVGEGESICSGGKNKEEKTESFGERSEHRLIRHVIWEKKDGGKNRLHIRWGSGLKKVSYLGAEGKR